jgi:hypothetical protein
LHRHSVGFSDFVPHVSAQTIWASDLASTSDGSWTVSIPIALVHGIPVVSLTVNKSKGELFIVDSGCAKTMLSSSEANRLKARLSTPTTGSAIFEGTGFTPGVRVQVAKPVVISFGKFVLKGDVQSIDLSKLGDGLGIRLSGVIGYDVLRTRPMAIDYQNKRFLVYEEKKFIAPQNPSVIRVTVDKDGFYPIVTAPMGVAGVLLGDAKILLDTGNDEALILSKFVQEYRLEKLDGWKLRVLAGMDSSTNVLGGESGWIDLGGAKVALDDLNMSTSTVGLGRDASYDVSVGGVSFSHGMVIFDVPKGFVYLMNPTMMSHQESKG